MKKIYNHIPFILIFIFAAAISFYFYKEKSSVSLKENYDLFSETSLQNASEISCTFERTIGVIYNGEGIKHGVPNKETTPIEITFSDLDTIMPVLKGKGAQDIVYLSSLSVVSDNDNIITLSETTPNEGNVFLYTLYKNDGVAVWSKHYSILGLPTGMVSMGKCKVVKTFSNQNKNNLSEKAIDNKIDYSTITKSDKEEKKEVEKNTTNKTWQNVMQESGINNKSSKIFEISGEMIKISWKHTGDSVLF